IFSPFPTHTNGFCQKVWYRHTVFSTRAAFRKRSTGNRIVTIGAILQQAILVRSCHRPPLRSPFSKRQSRVQLARTPTRRARQLAEIRGGDARHGIGIVHVVERVEGVASNLQTHSFGESEDFSNRNVRLPAARTLYHRSVRGTGPKCCIRDRRY